MYSLNPTSLVFTDLRTGFWLIGVDILELPCVRIRSPRLIASTGRCVISERVTRVSAGTIQLECWLDSSYGSCITGR